MTKALGPTASTLATIVVSWPEARASAKAAANSSTVRTVVARGTPDELRRQTGHDSLEDAFVALAGIERTPDETWS